MKANLIGARALYLSFIFVVHGCATVDVDHGLSVDQAQRQHLYLLRRWSFQGRLAVRSEVDSWSANIDWEHNNGREIIRLAGPLGQGAVTIHLYEDSIKIDHGSGRIEVSDNPDALVELHLGMFVPVSALRYWVVGLTQPGLQHQPTRDGFTQSGWVVDYQQYMRVGTDLMPRKLRVEKNKLSLKLVFDQWEFNE